MKIKSNFLVVSNYNNDISWIKDYTDNFIIYDRSDTPIDLKGFGGKAIKQKNVGYNLYDYFTFIIDNYENLPECTIFVKGNILHRHISSNYFKKVMNNTTLTKLEDKSVLNMRWPISYYDKKHGYKEFNNSWYTKHFETKYFKTYNSFLRFCFMNPKIPNYIAFVPGGNYIVPKKNILKIPKIFYENLRAIIAYSKLPGEAHIIERMLYTIWSLDLTPSHNMLKKLDPCTLPKFNFYNTHDKVRIFIGKILLLVSIFLSINKYVNLKSKASYIRNFISKINEPILIFKEKIAKKSWMNTEKIDEYRKNIRIYDIFTYNGEADILEIRLNILKDVVDQFIIVEAPTTFSGLKKPLYFEEQKERFTPFLDKIKYFVINDYPNDKEICKLADSNTNVPKNGPEHWRREFYQKESIKNALIHLSPDDICFIGDVDEIWKPNINIDYSKDSIFKLRQIVYSYYLNNRSNEPWAGTIVTKYKNIMKACLNDLRTPSKTNYIYLSNGGWHFTSMGGLNEVRRKLNDSYTNESYNTNEVQENLEKRFGQKDYIGRNFKFKVDEKSLPQYILKNKEKYINLFKFDPIS